MTSPEGASVRPGRTRQKTVTGPDGFSYTEKVNDEINGLAAGCLRGGAGPRFLQYLESITTRRVLAPTASDAELRHLEGARWLVGVIRQRMAAHKT